MSDMMEMVRDEVSAIGQQMIQWRRYLHLHPELSQQEWGTMDYVAGELRKMGYEPRVGVGKTGVVAVLQGEKNTSDYCIGLRADYDALPLTENTGLDFCSLNEGVMHACGHDMHTASLLGVARVLKNMQQHIEGTVMLIFEPSEEKYPGGARMMMVDGLFQDLIPNEMYAFHCLPDMECGYVGMKKGKYMASTDELYWTIRGKGGHGATPHLTIDPIVVASQIVIALQTIVSRNAAPMMPTVLTIGKIEGIGRTNIIPEEVRMEGIIRTFDEGWRQQAHQRIREVSEGIAKSFGAECDLFIDYGYPYLVNDDQCTEALYQHACEYLGADKVQWIDVRMTSEDFAFFAQRIPSCYFRVGVHKEGTPYSNLHRNDLLIDEDSLPLAAGLMAYNCIMALNYKLKKH